MENEKETPKYEVKPLLAEHAESGPKGLVVNGEPVPFVATPKLEEFPVQKYPVITDAEKLLVREAQFVRTHTREQSQLAVQNADQKLSATINALANKYRVDPKTSDFNMVTLTFVDKK
jgi:hypothetical protein